MRYPVDTDWVADYLKGKPPAVERLTILAADGLAISIITFAEIYEGIYYGQNRPQHEAIFRRFLHGVEVIGINHSFARRFALIRGQLRQRGELISQADLLIAATALEHNLTLVTRNRRDFDRIPGLSLYQQA